LGINDWLQADSPWFYYPEKLGAQMTDLVGADPEEVIVTSPTTVNLHSFLGSFYQLSGNKTKILADELNFPYLLSMAPLEGSLKIFQEAGIDNVKKKSLQLTSYMIDLLNEKVLNANPYDYKIGSPIDEKYRGGHVVIEHKETARINKTLKEKKGIISDFRYPKIIRFEPIALYNTFEKVWQIVQALRQIIENKDYQKFSKVTDSVT